MRKERNLKNNEVIKIENQIFNFIITFTSLLANIFTIINGLKNQNQYTNNFIQTNTINININNNSNYNNDYIYQQNKETKNKLISYFFLIIMTIIFIYNLYIEIQKFKFIQTGDFTNNISTNFNNLFINLLNVCNNSIFLITCLIIMFFSGSIIIFIFSKNYKLLTIHIIILLSFIWLAYNIYNFNINNIKLPTNYSNSIYINSISEILKNSIFLVPTLLSLYLIYIYWIYIEYFIKKDYNLNLIKNKIKICIFYFTCFLSIIFNILFYIYN